MLERTDENMSELRRNAIRRKSKPKQTAGSSAEECAESSGEWSGQVRADSPLMGLFLLVPNVQNTGCVCFRDSFVSQAFVFLRHLRNIFCGDNFFCQLGNIMLENLYWLTHYISSTIQYSLYCDIINPWFNNFRIFACLIYCINIWSIYLTFW